MRLKLLAICCLFLSFFFDIRGAGSEEELPPKIADYLKATESQASIGILHQKPQFDLLYAGLDANHRVGSIGKIDSFTVVQIVDGNNMRADITFTTPQKWKVKGPAGKDFWQLDTLTAKNVWLTQPTAGMVDGKSYRPPADTVYEAIGTQQYTTVTGAATTVLQFTTVEMALYRDVFIAARENRRPRLEKMAEETAASEAMRDEKKKQSEVDAARTKILTRTWKPVRGQEFNATFVGLDPNGDWVNLRSADGKDFRVRRSTLSHADKDWIRDTGLKAIDSQ